MKFNEIYKKLIQEISQGKINNTALSHIQYHHKNPVQKKRTENFADMALARAEKNGNLVRTVKPSRDKNLDRFYLNTYIFYPDNFTVDEQITGEGKIRFKVVNYRSNSMYHQGYFVFDYNQLKIVSNTRGDKEILESAKDAQNLAKLLSNALKRNISWKLLEFQ